MASYLACCGFYLYTRPIRSLRDKFGVIFSLLLARPLLAKPLLAKPLLAKPLLAKPLLAKPLLAKPLLAKPLLAKPLLAKPLLAKPLLAKPLLAKPLLAKPLLAKPLLAKPLLAKPLLAEPLFTYIQDHLCCSLRDKFGVIVSLLPFLLIYKTKWLRNRISPLLFTMHDIVMKRTWRHVNTKLNQALAF